MIKYSNKGSSRVVVLIGNYAIKIANPFFFHLHFLHGCYANYSERYFYKQLQRIEKYETLQLITPSLFCSYFGLVQIQRRCNELDRHLSVEEMERFKEVCHDLKKENFGYLEGNLVCFDYA